MVSEIRVPDFGESVVEATVGEWLKKAGDPVSVGEPVVELETEKVNVQVASEEEGVLANVLRVQGETVRPGDVLAVVEPGGAGAGREAVPTDERGGVVVARPAPQVPPRGGEAEEPRVSPVAQRLAAELGVDLSRVKGTGPGDRIMKEDVEAYLRQGTEGPSAAAVPAAPPAPAVAAPARPAPAAPSPTSPTPEAPPDRETETHVPAGRVPQAQPAAPMAPAPQTAPRPTTEARPETRQRLSRRRLTIARRLVEAQQTAAMLTTFNEIDMSAVVELRRRRRESFRQTTGSDLGFMSFFVRAVVGALKAMPQLNSELQGDELVLKQYYDIGIAIADPEGLVVPVLRDAERMSFAQIEKTIAAFVQKARDRTLTLEELRGGTFTITNGGVFGSLLSTPILNPPQVGILGMHKIADRPVASAGQVVIHPTMYVALTYDHRVVDGREAVLFLVRVKELIEDPERLLLEG